MERLTRPIGPLATNVHVLADPRRREAIAIDAAIPGLAWITSELESRRWRLRLIVSTHGHWDHAGENAALQAWSAESEERLAEHLTADHEALSVSSPGGTWADPGGPAAIGAHPDDWYRMTDPQPLFAPFPIPACVPAVELAEGGVIRFGQVRLEVLHTPGHTEGSVCLLDPDDGLLFSGDTLFAGGWGRVDLPGGSAEAMAASLARLTGLDDPVRVMPGHGPATTIRRERPWLDLVARQGRLPL